MSPSEKRPSEEAVKLNPSTPALDGLPFELFTMVLTLAIDTTFRAADYNAILVVSEESGQTPQTVITDLTTLINCLLVKHRFRYVANARKSLLTDSANLRVSRITSSKAIKAILQTHQLAINTQHLTIDAHLLPHFQAPRHLAHVSITRGSLVLSHLGCLTVLLSYDDEVYFSDRAHMREIDYVCKTVQRMLDGVKTYVEDFVFGFMPYKNLVQIQCSYKGNVELEGFIFDEKLRITKCGFGSKALWKACFRDLIVGQGESRGL